MILKYELRSFNVATSVWVAPLFGLIQCSKQWKIYWKIYFSFHIDVTLWHRTRSRLSRMCL